jgi:hypothetical protein
VNEVPSHGVYTVGLFIDYVLVIEEELIGLHQLWLALCELIRLNLVLENMVELEVIVRDRLPTKHDHGISVDHVKTYKPDLLLCHDVDDLPVPSLSVELLDGRPICEGLVSNRVNEPLGESAAVRSSYSLTKLRKSLLPFRLDVEAFTLPQIVAFQTASYYEDVIILLSNPEVYPIVHHLTERLELALGDIELDYL